MDVENYRMNSELKRQRFQNLMDQYGLKPATWARKAEISPNVIYNFLNGHSDDFGLKTLEKLAGAIGMSVDEFWRPRLINNNIITTFDGLHDQPSRRTERKIPIWGVVDAQDGEKYAVNTEDTPVDWVMPLPSQREDKDAFGLLISGESMSPRYMPGFIVFVHTRKPPIKGRDVVIELLDGGAYLKTYIGLEGDHYFFEQMNPQKRLKFKKSEIKRILPVVGVLHEK